MKRLLKISLLIASVALLMTGCKKENFSANEGEQTVTFSAVMANDVTTKAVADSDGAAASVNRCIMEIYYGDALFTRMYAKVSDKKCSFTLNLVSNRTYKVVFWADHVENTEGEAIATDLYYTTNAEGGLKAIALKGTYAGNADARDAFFYSQDYTVTQGGVSFSASLKRPFAQVNVITNDLQVIKPVPALVPDGVDVTIKNAYTGFNAVTGEVSAQSDLTYTATLYNFPATIGDKTDATLSMDYLFASTAKEVVDIDWKATKASNADVAHAFTNIPYQRNYRTNIKGALLTTVGQWNVEVDPVWESSKPGEQEIVYEVVNDIAGANTVITNQIAAGKKEISVKFTEQPNDAGTPGSQSQGITCNSILTTNLPQDGILNVLVEAQTKDLYIGDYTSATSTEVQTSGTQAAVVNINVPQGSGIQKLVINAPSKTVYLNGVQVASAGVITNLDAITSNNTLVIEAGQTVTTLTMRQGALKIHGTVGAVVIPDGHGAIYVRDCEGLSQSVYTVLEPYIDVDNGYIGEQEAGKSTYRIYQGGTPVAKIGENEYYVLNKAFEAVSEGQTIELLKDVTVSSTITVGKTITFDIKNYTITAGCSGYIFNINASTTGKTFEITGTDKDNCGHIISNGTTGHIGVACINGSSAAVTFEMNAVKVHGTTEADAYNAGNVIISDNSEGRGDLIKLTDVSIKGNQDLVSGSAGRAYASIDVKGGVYSSTQRGFRFCGAAASSSVIDGADITTANGIAVYAFSISTLKNSHISMTSSSNNDAVAGSRKYNNDAVLTIEDTDITVTEGSNHSKLPFSAIASEDKGVVIVKSGTFENKNASTYVVKVSTTGGVINFQGGTVKAQDGQTTMFANTQSKHDDTDNPSKVNITGGIIYGNCGVSSDNARVEINGGTFKDAITLHVQGSQHVSIMSGSTAVFEGKVTSTQTTAVTIPAGTFKKAIAEGDLKEGSTITGGTFYEAAPYSGYIATGYEAQAQGTTPESWTVTAK